MATEGLPLLEQSGRQRKQPLTLAYAPQGFGTWLRIR